MALTHTVKKMEAMLLALAIDLKKAVEKGNKAASQRVRTGSIEFAKLAKLYRKESIAAIKAKKSHTNSHTNSRKTTHIKRTAHTKNIKKK